MPNDVTPPTVVEQAARFAAAWRAERIDAALLHHAKRAVVDWHAAVLPGAVEPPATLLERALADELGHGGARLVLGRAAPARAAALVNGTAAHTVEVDDIYREAIYHPGAPTIAAALAVAQARGASGLDLLRAVVVGYEVSTRIGRTMGRAHYAHFHTTGTIGCFGAAAAEALALDTPRFAHALATAATFAAALQQAFRSDSMSKPLHAGRAAEAGVTAALAAAEGVTGALDVLEGDAGFGRALGNAPDWRDCMATLGREFHIAAMTVKKHACCGHTFAAIDGALALQAQLGGVAPDAIEAIDVATYGEALHVAGNPAPRTPAEARFSLAYVVASALRHGDVRPAAFAPARLADAATRALMARVRIAVDPGLDAAFPGQRAARVTFRLRDGAEHTLMQPTRRGDPDAPLTDAELDAKFRELATPVVGADAAERLRERLWRLDTLADLHVLAGATRHSSP